MARVIGAYSLLALGMDVAERAHGGRRMERGAVYCFGTFVVDAERFELRREGRPVSLQPRVFDLLLYLVRNPNRVVTRAELVAGPWNGSRVVQWAVNQAVMLLRRELCAGGLSDALVTVRQRGFLFRASVQPSRVLTQGASGA